MDLDRRLAYGEQHRRLFAGVRAEWRQHARKVGRRVWRDSCQARLNEWLTHALDNSIEPNVEGTLIALSCVLCAARTDSDVLIVANDLSWILNHPSQPWARSPS